MREILKVHLARPIARVSCVARGASCVESDSTRAGQDARQGTGDAASTQELAHLCRTVKSMAEKLKRAHEETIARNRSDIARLAVEIARKILLCKTATGNYDIQAIVEEALKRAPTQQSVVVRVNPEDLSQCQRLQQSDPDGPLAGLEFVGDRSIARADCLIETPKGIIKSFAEQHLERIGEALMQAQ